MPGTISRGLALLTIVACREACGQCHYARLLVPVWNAPIYYGVTVALDGPVALAGVPSDRINGPQQGSVRVYGYDGWSWAGDSLLPAFDSADYVQPIALEGDIAAVGSPGVKGVSAGAAYVFRRHPATSAWVQEATIQASDGQDGDGFGSAISVSGELIVAGAPGDDDNGQDAGAAYLFKREGDAWVATCKLLASDGEAGDGFGAAVAVQGDLVVVGAPGPHCFPYTPDCELGAVYVFRLDSAGQCRQEAKLLASDGHPGNHFGMSLDLSGVIAVGAGRAGTPSAQYAGAVYIFRFDRGASAWIEDARIVNSDAAPGPGDGFGFALAIDEDRLVVGAPWRQDLGYESGAAYLYRFDGTAWTDETKLLAPGDAAYGQFGFSVAMSGSFAIVGAKEVHAPCRPTGVAYIYDTAELDGRDCNGNGICDGLDLLAETSADCNGNGVPDECDVAAGWSADCNRNGIPDDCEPDCNRNQVQDGCDIGAGTSRDCNDDGVPDECDTAYALDDGSAENTLGSQAAAPYDRLWLNRFIVAPGRETIVAVAIAWAECYVPNGATLTVLLYRDPDNDGGPLDAVLLSSTLTTVALDARPDDFFPVAVEPTVAGRPGDSFFVGAYMTISGFPMAVDTSSPYAGGSWLTSAYAGELDLQDLSNNLYLPCPIHDCWDEANWTLRAVAGPPGACACAADLTGDCTVDGYDLALLLAAWGPCPAPIEPCPLDLDGDGGIGIVDLLLLLSSWG